jgi:hypothetical protein
MNLIRKAFGWLMLAVFVVLMAAPAFAHSGNSIPVAPNFTGMAMDDDAMAAQIWNDYASHWLTPTPREQ